MDDKIEGHPEFIDNAYHAAGWSCHPVTDSRGESLALAGGDSWANGTVPSRELLHSAKVKCVDFPSPSHPSLSMRIRKFPIIKSRGFFWNPAAKHRISKGVPVRPLGSASRRHTHMSMPTILFMTLPKSELNSDSISIAALHRIACCTASCQMCNRPIDDPDRSLTI